MAFSSFAPYISINPHDDWWEEYCHFSVFVCVCVSIGYACLNYLRELPQITDYYMTEPGNQFCLFPDSQTGILT